MPNLHGHSVLAYQPIKALFQLVYAGSIILRLPLWMSAAWVQALRQHPRWTAKQAFLCRAAYAVTDIKSRIGITEQLSLEPGKEGGRFQIVQPAEGKLYRGPLQSDAVKPSPVGATWFPKAPEEDLSSRLVVLYLHGGAFIQGDGRDAYCGFPAKTLLEKGNADFVFSLQYRLSGWAGLCPFPAALQDVLTAYLHLVHERRIPPRRIVLCGDSAGANLAIALLRYIEQFGHELAIPPPRCAALFSPWVAPLDFDTDSSPQRNSDFVPASFLRWGALTYTSGHADASENPYITPIGKPFATAVPLFVNMGTAEIMLGAIKLWAEEMAQVNGNVVKLHKEEGALHDTFLVADLIGFEESAQRVVSTMGSFVLEC